MSKAWATGSLSFYILLFYLSPRVWGEFVHAIPGNTWQHLCNTLWYLAILDNTFTILTKTKQYLPIPRNAYQLETIPNKTHINSYWSVLPKHQELSSILFQYHPGIITKWFCQFFVFLVLSWYWFWQFSQNLRCLFCSTNPHQALHSLPLRGPVL